MSISYSEIQDTELRKKVALYGVNEFVNVKIGADEAQQLQFPADYEFSTCFLPKKYIKLSDRIRNFKIRHDDIWIVTFPKSGTVWTYNIVWELINKLPFSTQFFKDKFFLFEKSMLYDENEMNKNDTEFLTSMKAVDKQFDEYENEVSPRLFMSHLPAHFLPKDIWTVKPKLFYIRRNAKDVAISMYHMLHNHKFYAYSGTMENFFDDFLNDQVIWSPSHSHVNGFQKLSHLDHVLDLCYEHMTADTFVEIKRISGFLNFDYSDTQLKQLTEHLSFQNMHNHSKSVRRHYKNNFK